MYHNSNYNNSNNKKISNKDYEKKNYNCFTFESSKPNFPASVGPSAALLTTPPSAPSALAFPLTVANDHASLLLLLHHDAHVSLSDASIMTPTGNVWRRHHPAQDTLYTGIHQTSR